MKEYFIIIFGLFSLSAFGQPFSKETGQFSGTFSEPLFLSTTKSDLDKAQLHYSFQSLYLKSKNSVRQTAGIKDAKMHQKLQGTKGEMQEIGAKPTAANPGMGINFKGNELKTWTPTDNSIAISNGGIIVSCINYGIEYYQNNGLIFLQNHTWVDFVNNNLLDQAKFDPRVIYDNRHDRFIVVLLHGFSSATSKILVCFSKSNNPLDGWNIYQMSGNPLQDTSWSDYPTIGLNDDELFINCNKFGDAPDYLWKKTFIYQIGLQEGYFGAPLQYGIWQNIYTPDSQDGITLYPASEGMGNSLKDKMYFVQLMPDTGNYVYVFELNGKLNTPNKSITATQYPIAHYEVCANALQKDPTTGNLDSLSTGSAWTQNAFYLNRVLHYTHSADMGNGWCGIQYGRIYLDSNKAVSTSLGQSGTDLAYPAIASFGQDTLDKGVVIAYVRSDSTIIPECGVVSIDDQMGWSNLQTIKTGDTAVNILYPPNYAVQPERWGDYSGICRKYNSVVPEAWLAACYGANTPPRLASYGTWIAQILSNEPLISSPVQKNQSPGILYPNPASDLFNIEFENHTAGVVRVQLLDASGSLVKILFNDYLRASRNKISFNKQAISRGNYFVKVVREGQVIFTQKFSIE